MAQFNDTIKHPASSFNNGEKYTVNDQMSIEALNNNIENSLYAVRVAENSQSATNNGVSYDLQSGKTEQEKENARTNIGATTSDEVINKIYNTNLNSLTFKSQQGAVFKGSVHDYRLYGNSDDGVYFAVWDGIKNDNFRMIDSNGQLYCKNQPIAIPQFEDIDLTISQGNLINKWAIHYTLPDGREFYQVFGIANIPNTTNVTITLPYTMSDYRTISGSTAGVWLNWERLNAVSMWFDGNNKVIFYISDDAGDGKNVNFTISFIKD